MSRGFDQDRRTQDRVRGSIHRGHVVATEYKDGRLRASIETIKGAVYTDVEIVTPIGMASRPKAGDNVEVLVQESGGEHSRLWAFGPVGNSDHHIQLEEGESALFNPENSAQHVKWDKDGNLVINTDKAVTIKSGQGMTLEAPTLTIKADVAHEGNMSTTGVHTDSVGTHI